MAKRTNSNNPLFQGSKGLLFHRNLIQELGGFGSKMASDFQAETGIPAKCEFMNRSLGGMKLSFKPTQKLDKKGRANFKQSMQTFIKKHLSYIQSYLRNAIKNTLGKSAVVEFSLSRDNEYAPSGQWTGGISSDSPTKDKDISKADWVGAKLG
jgi:hypothetical protein